MNSLAIDLHELFTDVRKYPHLKSKSMSSPNDLSKSVSPNAIEKILDIDILIALIAIHVAITVSSI